MDNLVQILLLLGVAVGVVVLFQRLNVPSSPGYLLAGVILGPHTTGPVIDLPQIHAVAEFGVVFLLFTIGLSYSLPNLRALRNLVFTLGIGQVVLTTLVVGAAAWAAGLTPMAAFVTGAMFAQSSSTVIGKQLIEQGESQTRHGRLGLAMSVFQDVTVVPFVVVIPALALATRPDVIATALGAALAKAVLAFTLVYCTGRWVLRPLFHVVSARRSQELFTLTVLLVALMAAWTTNRMGLSLAFGAFLAGMMLGETEFRHSVEAAIRPFRDLLLGLFFVSIGMLVDPRTLPAMWHWALLGTVVLLTSKTLIVAFLVAQAGIDRVTAWRTGLVLAVGGEFGFALLAIAIDATVVDVLFGQVLLTSVLLSMIVGPFLIRHNHAIVSRFVRVTPESGDGNDMPPTDLDGASHLRDHVIICGFGRIGQSVAHLLDEERIPYISLDLDPVRVREAHAAGEPVFFGDATERDVLDAVGLAHARLVVISHDDLSAALKVLELLRTARPNLPTMVRTRDETHVRELEAAGALEVVPETLEAGLMIASQALLLLDVPRSRVMRRIQEQRSSRYRLMREFFRGDILSQNPEDRDTHHLRSMVVAAQCRAVGRPLGDLRLDDVAITALVRAGNRTPAPDPETKLVAGDVLILHGPLAELKRIETRLTA